MTTAPLNFWLLVLPLFFSWNAGCTVSAQEFWNLTTSPSSMPVNEGNSLTLYCTTNNNDSIYSVYFSRASTTSSFSSWCSTYLGSSCSSQYRCNTCYCYSGSSSGVRRFQYNIDSVQPSYGGTWRCERSSSSSKRSNELIVSVNGKPTRPSLSPETGAVAEGDDVTLTCSSNATSMPASIRTPLVYSWRKDGGTISGETGSSLTLRKVTQSHQGRYTCTAQESGKSLSSDPSDVLFLDVQYPPSSVALSPSNSFYQVRETTGRVPNIQCQANCDPLCLFRWTDKGGNAVGSTGSRLQLYTLSRNEAGVFTCSGFNHLGIATATVSISVTYPPRSVTLDPPDSSIEVQEATGSVPDITCQADCNPLCSFEWTDKGGNAVGNTGSRLQLDPLSRNEAGVFTCSASNSLGTATATVSISVISTTPAPQSSALTGGAGIGIGVVIGCVISGLISGLLFFLCFRQRRELPDVPVVREEDNTYEGLDRDCSAERMNEELYQPIQPMQPVQAMQPVQPMQIYENHVFTAAEEGAGSRQAAEQVEEDRGRQAVEEQSQDAQRSRRRGGAAGGGESRQSGAAQREGKKSEMEETEGGESKGERDSGEGKEGEDTIQAEPMYMNF